MSDAYRKKFPKGKDWVEPTPNPHGFCGLNPDSYHGMETIAMDIDIYNQVKKHLDICVTYINQEAADGCERAKLILKEIGVIPDV